jgi:hypothetical protein
LMVTGRMKVLFEEDLESDFACASAGNHLGLNAVGRSQFGVASADFESIWSTSLETITP